MSVPAPVEFVPKERPAASSDADARMPVEKWSVYRLLFKSSVMTPADGVSWRYSHPKLTAYAFFLIVSFGLLYGQYRTSLVPDRPVVPRHAWTAGQVAAGALFAFGTTKFFRFYGYSSDGPMTLQPHTSLMGFAAFGIASLAFLWFQRGFYKQTRDSSVRRRVETKERIVRFINDE
eukprot:jgi/Mesvir1/14631/Mv05301-RA.1